MRDRKRAETLRRIHSKPMKKMKPLEITGPFPVNYSLSHVNAPIVHFPIIPRHVNDVLVAVREQEETWYGVFMPGAGKAFGLYSCPDPHQFCILLGGTAYIVNARTAASHAPYVYERINQVYPVPSRNMLLLADDVSVAAFSVKPLWHSQRICIDELRIEGSDNNVAFLSCWDPEGVNRVEFRLSLDSGEALGYQMP